jgi:uncharacterized membrane protein YdjX (TVP38/TMEM64 family)
MDLMNSNPGKTSAPRSATLRWRILAGAILLVAAVFLGREFGHQLPALEHWIANQGFWGWAVFILATMVCTSLFVPDTVFAVMAGVLFGVAGGTTLISVAVLLTATLNFFLARRWLFGVVRKWLEAQPRLAAIERAVQREGLRFQFLIRLTPLSPVAVSYVLGTTHTRFLPFLTACLGLIPGLFVEVYLGHVAQHVARAVGQPAVHSRSHTVITLMSLAMCLGVLAYITHLARRALAEAEARNEG